MLLPLNTNNQLNIFILGLENKYISLIWGYNHNANNKLFPWYDNLNCLNRNGDIA